MIESLRYIELDHDRLRLVVQFTGGGASVCFFAGEPAQDVITRLRHLADMLDIGMNARAALAEALPSRVNPETAGTDENAPST